MLFVLSKRISIRLFWFRFGAILLGSTTKQMLINTHRMLAKSRRTEQTKQIHIPAPKSSRIQPLTFVTATESSENSKKKFVRPTGQSISEYFNYVNFLLPSINREQLKQLTERTSKPYSFYLANTKPSTKLPVFAFDYRTTYAIK